jgi:flagellar protein FlbD
MIHVTRLNRTEYVINADYIETVEATPDTVITLTTERKYVVREPVAEIIKRVVAYKRACMAPALVPEPTQEPVPEGEK